MDVPITIDGKILQATEGDTILQAAQKASLFIPALCAHPDLPPQKGVPPASTVYIGTHSISHDHLAEGTEGCGICVVEVQGVGEVAACATPVRSGMVVRTLGQDLEGIRRRRLSQILATHPHACLTCAQKQGCTREPCSMNVFVGERCCPLLGDCELQALAAFIGIEGSTPRYEPPSLGQGAQEPLFDRDPALCISCGRCIRACSAREVTALGWVRDSSGRRWVGTIAPSLAESGCRFCGSCVAVCPTGALRDRGIKASDASDRQEALVPCRSACPAGIDVPRFVGLVAQGLMSEASSVVAERAPLVEVLGQICFHPCEKACRRNDVGGQPISICRIQREAGHASSGDWTSMIPPPREGTGKRVAVVGAGPAGLMASHHLRLMGHEVVLFEARDSIGGMLSHGIPAFRLSQDVAIREVTALVRGIRVRLATPVSDISALRAQHDAVVVASGAPMSLRLAELGPDREWVRSGLSFLSDLADGILDHGDCQGLRVAVVGGGNVALDCARAALRLGARRVDLVCLERREEMPAYPEEARKALREGVVFHHGWGILSLQDERSPRSLVMKRCTRVIDDHGSFAPCFDEAVTDCLEAHIIIQAIGQRPDPSHRGLSNDGIFLAGDAATGARSVVEALASGRQAALEVDRYLGGAGELTLQLGPQDRPRSLGRVEGFAALPRLEPPQACLSLEMSVIEPPLGPELASQEADRCLRCDLRLAYNPPQRPPSRTCFFPLEEASLGQVPQEGGVVRFFNGEGQLLEIAGGSDMRQEVANRLAAERAATFDFEACPLYSQRQNELLSHYVEIHGRMPSGASEEDLDDLY